MGRRASSASYFGQRIGHLFEARVVEIIREYLEEKYPDFKILEPDLGRSNLTLNMTGGLARQIDNVISWRDSDDPVALLETKWLKDGRHHNDKGAWILQLREIRKSYATIRGVAAVLAGYWTDGVRLMLKSEGGITMVLVATDEQVYETLQQPLDDFLGEDSFILDVRETRDKYPRPEDLANLIASLEEDGRITDIVDKWFEFVQPIESHLTGKEKVIQAIDNLIKPLPNNPKIISFAVTLEIDTGNTIHMEFTDAENALDFLHSISGNPQKILDIITPKPRSSDLAPDNK